MKRLSQTVFFVLVLLFACSTNDDRVVVAEEEEEIIDEIIDEDDEEDEVTIPQTFNILSLGDSYTIGQSVCGTCSFPEQLKNSLMSEFSEQDTFNLNVIAQTGWTTTNLINAIEGETLTTDYDLVTLLIGVNNQYQGKPFSLYETEFPLLVNKAIEFAEK